MGFTACQPMWAILCRIFYKRLAFIKVIKHYCLKTCYSLQRLNTVCVN